MRSSGEIYLLSSAAMNLVCLAFAARMSGVRARVGRKLLAALLGSGAALWLSQTGVSAYAALPVGLCMVLAALGRRGARALPYLMLAGLAAAGCARFLAQLGITGAAGFAAALCATLCARFLPFARRAGNAELEIGTALGRARVKAMIDTGNHLRDPVTGLPVAVVSREMLTECLPAALDLRRPETLPRGFRLLRVRTAAGSGLLPCFRPEELFIRLGKRRIPACAVVAVTEEKLAHGRALLPGQWGEGW